MHSSASIYRAHTTATRIIGGIPGNKRVRPPAPAVVASHAFVCANVKDAPPVCEPSPPNLNVRACVRIQSRSMATRQPYMMRARPFTPSPPVHALFVFAAKLTLRFGTGAERGG